jgi:WhiB family redox-sensing transcriptional regulator
MADTRLLPRPLTTVWDWQLRGACRGPAGDLFFHPDGERGAARTRRDVKAKTVCRRCPVLDQCLRHALATHEPHGVWGGLTATERRLLPGRGLARRC